MRDNKPLFRYFLDGTRRTYKVDDISYGERIYPIIAGQILVGFVNDPNQDIFKSSLLEKANRIVLPDCAD